VKLWITLGILLGLMVVYPALGTAVLGFLGALLVAAASQPTVWAFIAGLLAWPRIARTFRSLT
jgi:hypothetical protein